MNHPEATVPEAQATASAEFFSLLSRACRLAELPVAEVLTRARVSHESLDTSQPLRLPIEQVRRAFMTLDELAKEPLLGLSLASRLEPGGFDLLDYLVQHASTLGEACESFCRFMPLLANAGRVWLAESGDQALLCHHAEGAVPLISQLLVGGIVSRARAITGGRVRVRAVGFMHAARAPLAAYTRLLGDVKIGFGQVCDHVTFERCDLSLSVSRNDARLAGILRRQAEEQVRRIAPHAQSEDDALREAAVEVVLSGHASLERLAERLSTSPRTLQRRLAEAGLSHRRLMDSVRADLVEGALSRGDGSLSSLARRLGYATPGSLRRARERWQKTSAAH
jgi:AraC-like DNA-binding protein